MKRRISEWLSIYVAKNPGRTVLGGIFVFNIVFFMIASAIISSLSLSGTESMNFLEAAFCTITMILDAGCIQFVVADIGESGVAITVFCLVIIFVGMISFTGAVIGYITNYISDFITLANEGARRLRVSGHVVILNWNTRASEIINDLMYCDTKQVVVVLVRDHKAEIEQEINERLTDTVLRENDEAKKAGQKKFARDYDEKVTVIVREGDIFSSKQLRDISLERAQTVIILGDEYHDEGNSQTVKTLMQVADITSSETSADDQKVVVEITDEWTWQLVGKIIEYKQVAGKCNIVPVRVNKVLGQLLSQFSIMPELNLVFRELLSNKGMSFYYKEISDSGTTRMSDEIRTHSSAIPLSSDIYNGRNYQYYASAHDRDHELTCPPLSSAYSVSLDPDYRIERKHVIILGHNSKIEDIMHGFESFRTEWNREDEEIIDILVIDDEQSLARMGNYQDYPFVTATVAADIYDRELICDTISDYVSKYSEDTSILILSDDAASNDETDAVALANLVYVQNIIMHKKKEDPSFNINSMDVVVEIIDPKHHDVVSNYSVDNVVISNRYISKMITQIGEKDALFDFYQDILTFDTDVSEGYESMEIYTKRADRLFKTMPGACTAHELISAVYDASIDESLGKKKNPTVVLGYIRRGEETKLFKGNLDNIRVELKPDDLMVVYSCH